MERFRGDDHILNTFYLGTSSSRSDDVEWFTEIHRLKRTNRMYHIPDLLFIPY